MLPRLVKAFIRATCLLVNIVTWLVCLTAESWRVIMTCAMLSWLRSVMMVVRSMPLRVEAVLLRTSR